MPLIKRAARGEVFRRRRDKRQESVMKKQERWEMGTREVKGPVWGSEGFAKRWWWVERKMQTIRVEL